MTEPDFTQIAETVAALNFADRLDGSLDVFIAEALRLIWNARGAADIENQAPLWRPDDGTGNLGSILTQDRFERAIKALDR